MSAVRDLADEYYAYRQATEPHRSLYFGRVDALDRWEDVSPGAIADRQSTLRGFGRRAAQLGDTAGPRDDVLAETLAFTAEAAARSLTWRTEQTMVNPAIGLHTTLLTFLGRYSLATADHGTDYLTKLRALPALLDQVSSEVEGSARDGNVALRRHLVATADVIDGALVNRSAGTCRVVGRREGGVACGARSDRRVRRLPGAGCRCAESSSGVRARPR